MAQRARFEATQTQPERRKATNGIWLCHSCSDLVDKDETRFTSRVLEKWRVDHELWVAGQQGLVAKLPDVSFSTAIGLSIPPVGGRITADQIQFFREHRLVIKNSGSQRLESLSGRLQLPERAKVVGVEKPAGTAAELRPDRMEFKAFVTGGGSVQMPDVRDFPIPNFKLSIDRILPTEELVFTILSGPQLPNEGPTTIDHLKRTEPTLSYYLEASFVYERNQSYMRRYFLVPIAFDPTVRMATSSPCEDDDGTRSRELTMFSW